MGCSAENRGQVHLYTSSDRSAGFFLALHPTIFHNRGIISCPWIQASAKRTTRVSGTAHILAITSAAYVHSSYVPVVTHYSSSPSVNTSLNHSCNSCMYSRQSVLAYSLSLSNSSPILDRICQHCSLSRSMYVPLHCSILVSSENYYTQCKIYTNDYRPLAPVINSHFIPSATAIAFQAG